MAQIIHNISTPNDGLGDELRTAFDNQNEMNTDLYTNKVDKVIGKDLSDNNFSDADVTKLAGIEAGAEVNVQADWLQDDDTQDDFIKNKPDQLFASFGYFHISDLATQTTPLSFVASTPLQLTNDGGGAFTNYEQAPYGVSDIWNTSTNQFDFTKLSVGDAVLVRTDLAISTTSINQNLRLYIKFGIGTASEYDLLIDSWNEKSVFTFEQFIKDVSFSIDNEDWRDAPAEIYILSDDDGSVKVNGWYIPIIRKSVNIIDIDGGSQNLQQVTDVGNTTTNFIGAPMFRLIQGALEVDITADVLTGTRELFIPNKSGMIALQEDTVAKVTTSGVERAYIINADGSQGTKATSEFGGSESLLQVKGFATDFPLSNLIGTSAPMSNIALASGTADYNRNLVATSEVGHQGLVALRSSANLNSGFCFFYGGTIVNNGDKHVFFTQFKLPTVTDVKGYVGAHSSTTTAEPANSCFLEIVNNSGVFKTRGSALTTASTSFTLNANTWYSLMIEFKSTTEVYFKIKLDIGTVVAEFTSTTNLPSSSVAGFSANINMFSTVATTARDLMLLDYVEYRPEKPNHLKSF